MISVKITSLVRLGKTCNFKAGRYIKSLRSFSTGYGGQHVSVSTHDNAPGVMHVSLDRPPVNQLNQQHMDDIIKTIGDISKDPNARGIILTSSLPKIFCGGGDIEYMLNMSEPADWNAFSEALMVLWSTIYGCPLPIIAALNGHTVGNGCIISSATDYRIIVKDAKVGLPEPKLDIVSPLYFREMISDLIGRRNAEKVLVFGEVYSAHGALDLKLVDEVVDDISLLQERTLAIMTQILKIPEEARSETKLKLRRPLLQFIEQQRDSVIKDLVDQVNKPSARKNMQIYFESLGKRQK